MEFLNKYNEELQEVQEVAVPAQVAQAASHFLQILLSFGSPNSFKFMHESEQVLVPLLPTEGVGQAFTHFDLLRNKGAEHERQRSDEFTHVKQLASQVLQIRLSAMSPYSLEHWQVAPQVLVSLFPNIGLGHSIKQAEPNL